MTFLGIDIGTGSTKAVLTDERGKILATASISHSMSMPHSGWAEFDAEATWWAEVCQLSGSLLAEHGEPNALQGICVSGMGPCLVLTDDRYTPVRPAILYGVDTRATQQIKDLTEKFGAERIIERSGSELSSQAIGPKVQWVRENEPESWSQATRLLGLNSYIAAKLTGEYIQDHHSASQSDPLYDMSKQEWAKDWWEEIAPGMPAPRLAWPDEVIGTVTSEASEATGLPEGTPVCAGTVDAWAEAFSAGVRQPGDTMLMYGSTFFVVEQLSSQARHPGLWLTQGTTSNAPTLAAGTSTSGSLTQWLQELFGNPSFEELVEEAGTVDPGANGLILLPYFAGERTPIQDPQARGTITGLTLSHTRGHIFRAAYEGIACGLRQIFELLEKSAQKPTRIVAVGGGTKARLWAQIVSDVTGHEQQIPEQRIGASYGDALMAAIAVGAVPQDTNWAKISETILPDPSTRETYERLYERFTQLYPQTRETMHALAQEQGQ